MEISRWWSEERTEPPDHIQQRHAPRRGAGTAVRTIPAPHPGRIAGVTIRWFRFAPPPANFRQPSGLQTSRTHTRTSTVMLVSQPKTSTTFTQIVWLPGFVYSCAASLTVRNVRSFRVR